MRTTWQSEVKRALNEQIKQIEIYEKFLLEDNEWVQETQSSHLYADAVTAQEDVDHRDV